MNRCEKLVHLARLQQKNRQNNHKDPTSELVSSKLDKNEQPPTTSLRKRQKVRQITDREVKRYLLLEPATTALKIGLNVDRVKRAIKDRLQETGRPYTNSFELIEATLNLPTEKDRNNSDQPENSGLSKKVKRLVPKRFEENAEHATSLPKRQKKLQLVEEYVPSKPTAAASKICLHVDKVKQAPKDQVEETGLQCKSSDALLEVNLQKEIEKGNDSNQVENSRLSEWINKIPKPIPKVFDKSNTNNLMPSSPKVQNFIKPEEKEEAKPIESPTILSLKEENTKLKEARMCKICMDAETAIVFLPCGHLITCSTCAKNVQRCPLCRCVIQNSITTFLS